MKISSRNLLLVLFDIACYVVIAGAYFGIALVTDYHAPTENIAAFLFNAGILLCAVFLCRTVLGVYNMVWRYTSTQSYLRLVVADMIGSMTAMVVARFTDYNLGFWFFVTIAALVALMSLSARYCYRLLYKRSKSVKAEVKKRVNVGIVGAGQVGAALAGELNNNPNSRYQAVCFTDTDQEKVGAKVAGLPVLSPEDFQQYKEDYGVDTMIIALPKYDSERLAAIREYYRQLGCEIKLYDSPVQSISEGNGKRVIREFEIEDLLFRKPLSASFGETAGFYQGKTILVTGGGGSIGSELCRQIASCAPQKLIIFDVYENNAYDIQQELIRRYGDTLDLSVEIGTVRDRTRLEHVFKMYRPDVVFHAAAHKHVPLMEHSACEAIKNNVLGTYNTADMAEKYGVQKFILVSTDKAVNPTNIMGASKRLCEMVIQCRTDSKTIFAAVRFGNVLGSNGSVIPLFKRQIAGGGPITITDKRIIRYFMTIPEASQLVMTAGSMAADGELFVLDMGKPVKIYDLAVNMIKLSGLVPEEDIKIQEIGLRPGEKLYEELLMKTEELDKTPNNMIFIERDTPLTREEVDAKLEEVKAAVELFEEKGQKTAVKRAIKRVVPTFRNPGEVNRAAASSEEMKMAEEAEDEDEENTPETEE